MAVVLLHLSRSGRALAACVAVLAVGTLLAALVIGLGQRSAAREAAEQDARRLAMVLSEQTARALHAIDLMLADLAGDAELAGAQNAEQFRAVMTTPQMQRAVRARVAGLPDADAIVAIAADGTVLLSSRIWPAPAVNVADRPYFQAARDSTLHSPFLSEAIANRFNGTPVFSIVRRINDMSGALRGVLLGSIDLDYLGHLRAAADLPPGAWVALVRQDGEVVTRFPADAVRAPAIPAQGLRTGPSGLIHAEPVGNLPAFIEVGIAAADIDAAWHRPALLLGAGTAGVLVCLLVLLCVLLGQLHRLQAARVAMQEKSVLLETTLANMDQGLIMVTGDHTVAVCNDRAIRLLGLPPDLMHARPSLEAVLDWQWQTGEFGDDDASMRAMRQLGGILDRPHTYERRRPDGTCLEVRSTPLAGGGVVRTFTDVTLRRLADEQASYAALHDPLTGLSNRTRFARRLEEAVLAAPAEGHAPAVLCFDLDRLKLVNDTLGHHAGDELLQQVAARMASAVRERDTLARMGGDEFALLMPEAPGIEAAVAIAQRLLFALRQPFSLADGTARIGVSIGIAGYGLHGTTPDQLLRNADLALYRAKTTGRDTACVFDALLDTRTQGELLLEGALQHALQERQFTLVYQPIWDIRSNCIVGAEALLRWQHPTRGIISPADFIPLAERTGLIVPLGRWAMEAACREALTWASPVSVSVNVAPSQLRRPEMFEEVRDMLAATGLPPSRLKLEITESQLLDDTDEVTSLLGALRGLGLGLALDDFGTGHSSLSTLQAFPFSDLKIDRCFTQGILQEGRSRGLLEAILQVCRVMDLDCVAEGVETEEQLSMLRSLGCTHAQGYLIGRPEPAEAIRRTLWRTASLHRQPLPAGSAGPDSGRAARP